jgi:hypothetical protein
MNNMIRDGITQNKGTSIEVWYFVLPENSAKYYNEPENNVTLP